ncbi:MAG: glycogen debranching enzyme GlgX, partial [Rhodobacteraceae bacterium]|nr:glycogen debranching enzyme GlgX [Paracoccaceae bacterium]
DRELEAYAARLSALRRATPALARPALLTGAAGPDGLPDVVWLTPEGKEKTAEHWDHPEGPALAMILACATGDRLAVLFNRSACSLDFRLPRRSGRDWLEADGGMVEVPPRSVAFVTETAAGAAQEPLEPAAERQ